MSIKTAIEHWMELHPQTITDEEAGELEKFIEAAKEQPDERTDLDPLILAAQEALDVMDRLKAGRKWGMRESSAVSTLSQEMREHLKRKSKRESGKEPSLSARAAADFLNRLASMLSPVEQLKDMAALAKAHADNLLAVNRRRGSDD